MFVRNYYPKKRRTQNNLENVLNGLFTDFDKNFYASGRPTFSKKLPAVNIFETKDDFQIELAAPGLLKKEIKIDLEENILRISGKKITEKKEGEEKKYTLREFNFSDFERSFTLPETIDNQGISAKFENGILILTLAKKEEAKPLPPRTVAIV